MMVRGFHRAFLIAVASAAMTGSAAAQPSKQAPADFSKILDVAQLRLDMAESNVRIKPTLQNISDLVSALEQFLNTTCLKDLPKTLVHKGSPTDPVCLERMERLLQLNPDNPVGICLRDGIAAETCVKAYASQQTIAWNPGIMSQLPDPILKVGLSAAEVEQLEQLDSNLAQMEQAIEAAKSDKERAQIEEDRLAVFDRAMSIGCRIAVLALEERPGASTIEKDQEYVMVQERLRNQSPTFLENDQDALTEQYELKLVQASDPKLKTLYKAILQLIQNPNAPTSVTAETVNRVRYILPECTKYTALVSEVAPYFPSWTCHYQGWYTPKCVDALKNWQKVKRSMAAKKAGGAPAAPTPSLIGTF